MIQYEYINEKGRCLAERIKERLKENENVNDNENTNDNENYNKNDNENTNAIVFVGALGICVRKILPLVNDKHTDPAVVCVDTTGKYVIPVLSGHVGGANKLARTIARAIGAEAVITTQSDNSGLWALDTLAKENGWVEGWSARGGVSLVQSSINNEIALFVNGEPTALLLDCVDEGTKRMLTECPSHVTIVNSAEEITAERFRLAIIVSPRMYSIDNVPTLHYIPKCTHAGIGLAHQAAPAEEIISEIYDSIAQQGISPLSIKDYSTIDLKADEPVVKLLQSQGETVLFYTADQLNANEVPNPSTIVSKHVGTPSVSESAALMHGDLIMEKTKGKNWTVALSMAKPRGHIEIVGAGPGDPELISIRGRRFLEQADLILYAGSLVPRELTECHKPGATVRSSADMDLDEQFALMKQYYDQGLQVVRLHTGDPCIYGAIQEQMAFFDTYGMHYHITPGISSFLAAAAELQSQFTIPERCQTIILTRGEGRTPMPDKEKLHMLAQHQSTMCIFLSASIVDDVQKQLLDGGYPPETPIAACYKLTWKDQKIYRGKLIDLADIIHSNHLTLTTMIVVGEAIDNRQGLSKLYDGHFTHLFRKGK